jgi:hypothetical protein
MPDTLYILGAVTKALAGTLKVAMDVQAGTSLQLTGGLGT